MYVADVQNFKIRKITSSGGVTTFAGSTMGWVDGRGTLTRFNYPSGLVIDSSGNIYVSDINNNRIRKITSAAVVTTLAGTTTGSWLDGTGSSAKFNSPYGITVDSGGYLYVGDTNNNRIRKVIASTGVAVTLAGSGVQGYQDGSATTATFHSPRQLAVDSRGNVYVADYENSLIRCITSSGLVTSMVGVAGTPGYADGLGSAASLSYPSGVVVDSLNNLYTTDYLTAVVRKVSSTGFAYIVAGSGASSWVDGTASATSFNGPYAIAMDSSRNLYVSDFVNNRIRKVWMPGVLRVRLIH